MAERRRDARLGERLRLVGRLERPRQGAAPRDAPSSGRTPTSCDGRVDAARGHGGGVPPEVVASRWSDGGRRSGLVANRAATSRSRASWSAPTSTSRCPGHGHRGRRRRRAGDGRAGGESRPSRRACRERVAAPVARAAERPAGLRRGAAPPARITSVFRRRETGTYGEAPYVEEWKPLPPRLHDLVEVDRETVAAPRFAIAVREVTNAELGARRAAGRAGDGRRPRRGARVRGLGRRTAADRGRVATRGRGGPARARRAARLELDGERAPRRPHALRDPQGRLGLVAEGSDWYVDGGPQDPRYSLKLLLPGGGLGRSSRIGFRLAVDLA